MVVPGEPRLQVLVTVLAPCFVKVTVSTGPVAPSLRVKVYFTVTGFPGLITPTAAIWALKVIVVGHLPE